MTKGTDIGPFAIVPVWLLRYRLSGGEIATYVALKSFANQEGECWPSVRKIADRAYVSESTCERALTKLRSVGLIASEQWHRGDGSTGGSVYHLYDVDPTMPPPDLLPPPRRNAATPGVTYDATPGVISGGARTNHLELTKNSSPAPADDDVLDVIDPLSFDAFWAEYPRKVGKGAARKAWLKAIGKTDQGRIIDAARGYAARVAAEGTEIKYVKHPSPWLNDERWADITNIPDRPRTDYDNIPTYTGSPS